MGWDEFEAEFARGNGLFLGGKRAKMMGVVFEHEEDPSFANFFRGSRRNHYLLVSGEASYCLRLGVFGVRANWIVDHRDLVTEAWHRRGTVRGYVLDEVVLQHRGGTESFRVGGGDPRGPAGTHHRLRAITAAIERSRGNPALYRHALDIDVP
jgi:hypothetical protein